MFRLWARTFRDNHMLKDTCICDDTADTRTHKVFRALEKRCNEFDLGKPIWLDKTIRDVDALNSGLPVLLKKYIKLNAKIVCFNVDPKFNNCLDGLIMLDIFDIPRATVESLHKEVNDGSILERFYSNRE